MAQDSLIRVVLDTNVLLGSARHKFLQAAETGQIELVWSSFIEAEMRDVMRRINWQPDFADSLLARVRFNAILIDHKQITGGNYEDWIRDPDDYPIMATAIAGKVDYLVTNNTKDFPSKKRFADITIITPDAFLAKIGV